MRGLPPDDLLSRPALVYSAHVIEAISQYHGKNTESDQYRAQIRVETLRELARGPVGVATPLSLPLPDGCVTFVPVLGEAR
jgi:hypothetical protein